MLGPTDEAALLGALDALEDYDARNLAWGLIDESWSEGELLAQLARAWPEQDPRAGLDLLLSQRLVVEVPATWPPRYRTRMGEAMRLFARLRQLFPKKPWQTSARLVADFRFRHEPRRFPRREITPLAAIERLATRGLDPNELAAATAILSDRRLSDFQMSATEAVFDALGERLDRGVVVGAGTGSGKTLAFYLPALAHLGGRPARPEGTGIVAIYPRNELLKDQLATALDEVRQLRAAGGRALRIGAFFGPAPTSSRYDPDKRAGWRKTRSGWVCPFLTCRERSSRQPGKVCDGQLIWLDKDRQQQVERLECARCGGSVRDDELVLTRNGMKARPPDVVFTTTEMLNRCLSDGWSMHVFGVGLQTRRAPALVLLDEVHTYEGVAGAQAAYLLRRWRHLMGRPVTWVGLSATLANAKSFFASLCGIAEESVVEVRPQADELEERGREYQVVLRGDPASQSALLSTSIQALMLLRRVLEPTGPAGTTSAFGSRVFAFCDNLDLVNRLYRQFLDAEGLDPFGRPDPRGHLLAGLRLPAHAQRYGTVSDWPAREADGQHWWLVDELGFGDRPLTVARTSSQDSGVDSAADVIVATASLEVGYDDPTVGGVLQHKAPRDVAQFLQRRGRAGRTQVQRPWTVVVLSDYGRDRSAYQDYETLLDPALPAKSLPLGNQSVRKMQAAMCLVDWTARQLRVSGRKKATMRTVFADPAADGQLRLDASKLLSRVLEGGHEQDDLVKYVSRALGLTGDDLLAVCWEQPRALLLDAVPTAVRRLSSKWGAYHEGAVVENAEPWVKDHPLPEFIPKSLFSDLCLPEVLIEPPEGYDPAAETTLPVAMALNELAPGKVTLRWAVQKVKGLWIAPPTPGTLLELDAHLAPGGEVLRDVPGPGGPVPLVRPLTMRPTVPDSDILPSSNGRMHWNFLMEPVHAGIELVRPRTGPLTDVILSVTAYLHAGRGALRTWRYATSVTSDTARRSGRERSTAGFAWQGDPAAVGFEAVVDALVIKVRPPACLTEFRLDSEPRRLRQLRRDWFFFRLQADLQRVGLDPFLARWISEVVGAIAARIIAAGSDLGSLVTASPTRWREMADEAVQGVLLSLDEGAHDEQPLRDGVLDAMARPEVVEAIHAAVPLLSGSPDATWVPWLRDRWLQTIAAAWQSAAQQICQDFDVEDDCVFDVVDDGTQASVVMTDASVGGGGLLEALTSRISDDPRRFDHLVVAALEPSDLEDVDRSLRRTLDLLASDQDTADAAQLFRSVTSSRLEPWKTLIGSLIDQGLSPAHATLSALGSRLFRVGSSPASDNLLRSGLSRWEDLELQAGFAIDHRAACALLADDSGIRSMLATAIPGAGAADSRWAQSVLLGLLWVSAEARRSSSLVATNRFVEEAPLTERTLLLDSLGESIEAVDVDDENWLDLLTERLGNAGRCRLTSGTDDRRRLKSALLELATRPIELGWLHVHPHLEALTRTDGIVHVEVSLEEAPQ